MEIESSERLLLNNNSTLSVPHSQSSETIEVFCPKLEVDNVFLNTNSNFCKVENVIDYIWQKCVNTNWLTVHRSNPFIAYVIQPEYCESIRQRKVKSDLDPRKQVIKIHNYLDQKRALAKTCFAKPIADIAFAYNSNINDNENKLAAVDKSGNVQLYDFKVSSDNDTSKITMIKILEIVSDTTDLYSYAILSWCPYHCFDEDEDMQVENLGMKLALSLENKVEIFSIDKFMDNDISRITRSELKPVFHDYQLLDKNNETPIISLSLSNDASAICTASLDNNIKFFSMEENKELHCWTPKLLSHDKLSCFFFLDDYNELLENKDIHFWGHALIGTTNGHIAIWDLRKWKPIQRVYLNFQDDEEVKFEYRIDVTSHALVAISNTTAFLLLLSFLVTESDEANKAEEEEDEDEEDNTSNNITPKIIKITRFQLYNPIISFAVKRESSTEINIFWMTQKSLEKCCIDVNSLVVTEKEDNILGRFGLQTGLNTKGLKDALKNLYFPSLGTNDSEEGDINPVDQIKSSFDVTPSVELAEMFSTSINLLHTSVKTSSDEASKKSSFDKSNPRAPTPASKEVAHLLHEMSGHKNSTLKENMAHMMYESPPYISNLDEVGSKVRGNFEQSPQPLNLPYESLPKDLVTEAMLKRLENNLISQFSSQIDSLRSDIVKLNTELISFRNEMKDPSQYKASNKVIDGLIRKLMGQMNSMFGKGLEEIMGQFKMEISSLTGLLNQSRSDFNHHYSSIEKQFSKFEAEMQELRKKLKDCNKQQQEMYTQLETQRQQIVANSSYSQSPMLRSNSLSFRNSTSTPQPSPFGISNHLAMYSTNEEALLRQQQEKEKRRKEEERAMQLKQIWSRVKSSDKNEALEGIRQALNMKESSLITEICQYYYSDLANPASLASIISKDQSIILSFLNHLALSDLKEEKWKIQFITLIVPHLDNTSPLVQSHLPHFSGKLISRLEEANQASGGKDPEIPLILRILKLYCDHR